MGGIFSVGDLVAEIASRTQKPPSSGVAGNESYGLANFKKSGGRHFVSEIFKIGHRCCMLPGVPGWGVAYILCIFSIKNFGEKIIPKIFCIQGSCKVCKFVAFCFLCIVSLVHCRTLIKDR